MAKVPARYSSAYKTTSPSTESGDHASGFDGGDKLVVVDGDVRNGLPQCGTQRGSQVAGFDLGCTRRAEPLPSVGRGIDENSSSHPPDVDIRRRDVDSVAEREPELTGLHDSGHADEGVGGEPAGNQVGHAHVGRIEELLCVPTLASHPRPMIGPGRRC